MRRLLPLLLLSACASPFLEVSTQRGTSPVTASYCGSTTVRAASVIAAMDGPPLGETGSGIEPPKELEVCVRIDNRGNRPVKVDRSRFHLRSDKHDTEGWVQDRDDARFVVPPGESRKTHVAFHYSPNLLSGEEVRVDFDEVIGELDHPLRVPPIVLRRK
jgi:hypothetical protein